MQLQKRSISQVIQNILVGLCIFSTIFFRLNLFDGAPTIGVMLTFVVLVIFAWIQGIERYGIKNMFIWFVITWVISNSLESLSILGEKGFPFGHYHYAVMENFSIGGVPIPIMIVYFGISYLAWTVAQSVLGIFDKPIVGFHKFLLPLTAAIIMGMFDLTADPRSATISGHWVWENGGEFFGVPTSNFYGWVFVVYLFMQVFTLFISRRQPNKKSQQASRSKFFWLRAAVIYLMMGIGVFIEGFTHTDHQEIYSSMAMLSLFTMIFVGIIAINSILRIRSDNDDI